MPHDRPDARGPDVAAGSADPASLIDTAYRTALPGTSLDYSLQLSLGIKNFQTTQQTLAAPAGSAKLKTLQAQATDARSPRDGALTH